MTSLLFTDNNYFTQCNVTMAYNIFNIRSFKIKKYEKKYTV